MFYMITGKLIRKDILELGHEEYVNTMASKVVPSLRMMVEPNTHGKVIGGGVPAGSRDLVMIVDLNAQNSHRCVRQFLASLPIFDFYEWETTPLETFDEMARAFSG